MKVLPNPLTIGYYVEAVESRAIRVNQTYQRGGGIWSSRAKSALIETVILGYPMPALFLHQLYDRDTRKPYQDLVDGQQRTDAIIRFHRGDLPLSSTLPTIRLRKCKLADLDEDDYHSFITYSLPIFLFTDATDLDVREAFRRINSHTSVLNAEERRHARFQGAMKWFVLSLSKDVQVFLQKWGVYTEQKIIRMQDARFVSELILVFKSGITTVKETHLERLYQDYDDEGSFPDQDSIRERALQGFQIVAEWEWIHSSALMKPYQLTLLILAIMHAQQEVDPLSTLASGSVGLRPSAEIEARLGELLRALEFSDILVDDHPADDDEAESEISEQSRSGSARDVDPRLRKHIDFVRASSSKTNTESARKARFRTLYAAIARTPS